MNFKNIDLNKEALNLLKPIESNINYRIAIICLVAFLVLMPYIMTLIVMNMTFTSSIVSPVKMNVFASANLLGYLNLFVLLTFQIQPWVYILNLIILFMFIPFIFLSNDKFVMSNLKDVSDGRYDQEENKGKSSKVMKRKSFGGAHLVWVTFTPLKNFKIKIPPLFIPVIVFDVKYIIIFSPKNEGDYKTLTKNFNIMYDASFKFQSFRQNGTNKYVFLRIPNISVASVNYDHKRFQKYPWFIIPLGVSNTMTKKDIHNSVVALRLQEPKKYKEAIWNKAKKELEKSTSIDYAPMTGGIGATGGGKSVSIYNIIEHLANSTYDGKDFDGDYFNKKKE